MQFSLSYLLIFCVLIFSSNVFSDQALLKSTIKKYKNSALVEMEVEKAVKSELLDTVTKYKGKIYLSSGLFRFDNLEPEKSLLVFDGTYLWNEQSPPVEFPGPVQVAKSVISKKNKSQILISSLLGQGGISENFKIIKEQKENGNIVFTVEPKTPDLSIKSLDIVVQSKLKTVNELKYKDDVGNETKMVFTNTKFKNKKNNKLFKYAPPKNSQVINL